MQRYVLVMSNVVEQCAEPWLNAEPSTFFQLLLGVAAMYMRDKQKTKLAICCDLTLATTMSTAAA